MRAAVNVFPLFSLASALLVAPAAVWASEQEGADRFVPTLEVSSGVSFQAWDASVDSQVCRGCSFPNPSAEMLRPSKSDSSLDVAPFVGGVLELMTPELPLPGSPRLFFGGEYAGSFGAERRVVREGNAGEIGSPNPPNSPSGFDEASATGVGSETISLRERETFGALAGVALPIEIFGRQMRIRTSIAWIRYGVDLKGLVNHADCKETSATTTQCNPNAFNNPGFLRPVALRGEATGVFDGIGPGLDIVMDTGRFGPVGSSVRLGARAYRIIGDRKVEFSSPVLTANDQLGTDQNLGHFEFEADDWLYRVGIGFRLQWLGNP